MLVGGTAGQQQTNEQSGATFGSFTRTGVKTVYASPKKQLDVRVLPAFDPTMSQEDEAYKESFCSYREQDSERTDPDTETEPFTAWFYVIEGYSFFGLKRKQFISPLTLAPYFPAGHDPVRDCWVHIDKKENDPRLKHLITGKTIIDPQSQREKKLQGYLSKTPRRFGLMNVLARGDTVDSWENAVLVVPLTTLLDLKEQLSIQTKRSDQVVITPEWEDYYYGDITHPEYGPICQIKEKYVTGTTGNSIRTSGFYLDQAPNTPDRHNMMPRPVSVEELKGRYNIGDTQNVTNLEDKATQYQIILDYLVEDGVIPLHIIRAACGQYGKIKPELRAQNLSWFEGEPPLADPEFANYKAASGVGVASKPLPGDEYLPPIDGKTTAGDPNLNKPTTTSSPNEASAVSSLPPAPSTAEVVEEEVPMGDPDEATKSAEKASVDVSNQEPNDDVKAKAKADLDVLMEKMAGGTVLDEKELGEVGRLTAIVNG
jgi:hypothetical protein